MVRLTQQRDCVGHKLDTMPPTESSASKEELISYFKDMAVIRRMETTASEAYRSKQIRGFLHLYSGQVSRLNWRAHASRKLLPWA